jgi:hypothetical protein
MIECVITRLTHGWKRAFTHVWKRAKGGDWYTLETQTEGGLRESVHTGIWNTSLGGLELIATYLEQELGELGVFGIYLGEQVSSC